jgi:glutaredoxin-like protein NrdH
MNIQVYSKPNCPQCEYTEKKLSEWQVPHSTIDVTQNPAAFQRVLSTGNMQMPMVVAGEDSWHGFKYDKLKELKLIAGPSYGFGIPQSPQGVSSCPPQEGYL